MGQSINIGERNEVVDSLRGFAILLVVLGHTMTSSTIKAENSLLFNVIWALQMPLFFLISGYVTHYSKPIVSIRQLFRRLLYKTCTYLLPWFSWSILIRGVIFGEEKFLDFNWLFNHMDTGYWFLFSLWSICIFFTIAQYFNYILLKTEDSFLSSVLIVGIVIVQLFLLMLIGYPSGFLFFGIKYTLYYSVYYMIGFIWGKYQKVLMSNKKFNYLSKISIALGSLLFLYIIKRFCLFQLADNINGICLRMLTSMLGCIIVCALFQDNIDKYKEKEIENILLYFGTHSMEVYLIHYIFLSLLHFSGHVIPHYNTLEGVLLVTINYFITLLLSTICIILIDSNKYLKKILFFK